MPRIASATIGMSARAVCRCARIGALCGIALLAGCNSLATRPAESAANAPVRTDRASPERGVEVVAAPAAPAAKVSAVDSLLAERRRGDYPEVETTEFGFTITEQIRIGGSARADYDRALVLLDQDRYEEGIALLEEVRSADPELTAPYVDLGIAYARAGDLEKAEERLVTARLLSPDHPIVHNELGIIYRKTGRFAEARASYETALAVFDGFHFARRNLGVLCDLYLNDLDCALGQYRAYLDAVGTDSEVEIWIADLANRAQLPGGE